VITAAEIYNPVEWHDYFLMVGTGAAALSGLVFVAMSLNLRIITGDLTHRYRAVLLVAAAAISLKPLEPSF
jgi:hypothetical protein